MQYININKVREKKEKWAGILERLQIESDSEMLIRNANTMLLIFTDLEECFESNK